MRILVVDDERSLRRLEALSLEREGHTVIQAESGEECLHLAKIERPDAVLLDLNMPHMDGGQVLEALRAEPATSGIPVVILTASPSAADVERLRSLGAVGVLAKPFRPATLANSLMAVLAHAHGKSGS